MDENESFEGNHSEKINNNKDASFAMLFNNPELSDIIICVNSRMNFHAHRLVLASRSEVFKAMLSEKWNDRDVKILDLQENLDALENFHDFLLYIYSGQVNLTMNNVAGIYTLSDKYNIACLRACAMQYMSDHIATNSRTNQSLNWLIWAQVNENTEFEKKCLNFILNNFNIVSNSQYWMDLDSNNLITILQSSDLVVREELEVLEAVEKWLSNKEVENIGFLLKSIISYLRLPQIWPITLSQHEQHSELMQRFKKLFIPELLDAYRFQSLPVESRMNFLPQSSSIILSSTNNITTNNANNNNTLTLNVATSINSINDTESTDSYSSSEIISTDIPTTSFTYNDMKYKMRTYTNKNFCFHLELKQDGDHYGPLTFATSKSSSFLDQAAWSWNFKLYYNPNNCANNKLRIAVSDVYNKQAYAWNNTTSSATYANQNLSPIQKNVQIAFLIGLKKKDGYYYKQYKYTHNFSESESFELCDFYKDWNLDSNNQKIKMMIVMKPIYDV